MFSFSSSPHSPESDDDDTYVQYSPEMEKTLTLVSTDNYSESPSNYCPSTEASSCKVNITNEEMSLIRDSEQNKSSLINSNFFNNGSDNSADFDSLRSESENSSCTFNTKEMDHGNKIESSANNADIKENNNNLVSVCENKTGRNDYVNVDREDDAKSVTTETANNGFFPSSPCLVQLKVENSKETPNTEASDYINPEHSDISINDFSTYPTDDSKENNMAVDRDDAVSIKGSTPSDEPSNQSIDSQDINLVMHNSDPSTTKVFGSVNEKMGAYAENVSKMAASYETNAVMIVGSGRNSYAQGSRDLFSHSYPVNIDDIDDQLLNSDPANKIETSREDKRDETSREDKRDETSREDKRDETSREDKRDETSREDKRDETSRDDKRDPIANDDISDIIIEDVVPSSSPTITDQNSDYMDMNGSHSDFSSLNEISNQVLTFNSSSSSSNSDLVTKEVNEQNGHVVLIPQCMIKNEMFVDENEDLLLPEKESVDDCNLKIDPSIMLGEMNIKLNRVDSKELQKKRRFPSTIATDETIQSASLTSAIPKSKRIIIYQKTPTKCLQDNLVKSFRSVQKTGVKKSDKKAAGRPIPNDKMISQTQKSRTARKSTSGRYKIAKVVQNSSAAACAVKKRSTIPCRKDRRSKRLCGNRPKIENVKRENKKNRNVNAHRSKTAKQNGPSKTKMATENLSVSLRRFDGSEQVSFCDNPVVKLIPIDSPSSRKNTGKIEVPKRSINKPKRYSESSAGYSNDLDAISRRSIRKGSLKREFQETMNFGGIKSKGFRRLSSSTQKETQREVKLKNRAMKLCGNKKTAVNSGNEFYLRNCDRESDFESSCDTDKGSVLTKLKKHNHTNRVERRINDKFENVGKLPDYKLAIQSFLDNAENYRVRIVSATYYECEFCEQKYKDLESVRDHVREHFPNTLMG